MSSNPFLTGTYNGQPVGATCAADRIELVRTFDRERCRAALHVKGLQRTVVKAVERRLRELDGR